jgi:3-hydroxyacyl-[acyl-carrier-protein] dehydratase
MSGDAIFDSSQIQQILPHRPPFLFVDRVMELETGKRIIAEKDLLHDESFFAGHFPGRPLMPGVLVSEALAQASGLLLGISLEEANSSSENGDPPIFQLASVNVKFISPAEPGQTLRLESILKKEYARLCLFDVKASVGGNPTAKGSLTLAWVEKYI